ncbi:MAG TPA: biopolymer transporter ExbD [Rhodoferax sp.]|jgi:biopolymer transport protein ExbD|nr:biopolymer transporter ExbD [Rhodoferax sp.]HPW28737.1 biopolymer transporter ExbD [Rhodoferax sp.]
MAIDFESFDAGLGAVESDDAMLSEINTTPLVDVMLVLLIIFLITIPVVNAAVAVTLPREANLLRHAQPQTVIVSVDAAGATYWFDAKLASSDLLQQRLAKIAAQKPQPEVHIRADASADFAAVAQVVYACQVAGIARVGFLTEPPVSP